jgi:hypothetical protein
VKEGKLNQAKQIVFPGIIKADLAVEKKVAEATVVAAGSAIIVRSSPDRRRGPE